MVRGLSDGVGPGTAALTVAAPAVLATLMVLGFSSLELMGRTPFAVGPFRNVAEAAGIGAASEVLRLLGAGEDPTRVQPVRSEIISSSVRHATALEAAVWSRRRELVELLDRRGAIVDSDTRRHLTCLAGDLDVGEIVDYLSPGRSPACVRGDALGVVLQRTRALDP
jgi:hypothetical protein